MLLFFLFYFNFHSNSVLDKISSDVLLLFCGNCDAYVLSSRQEEFVKKYILKKVVFVFKEEKCQVTMFDLILDSSFPKSDVSLIVSMLMTKKKKKKSTEMLTAI